jgi:hypothetical protein
MHESGDNPIGIELAIGRIVLIPSQCQKMLFDVEPFLRERDAHLLSAYRIDIMIMLKHRILPDQDQSATMMISLVAGVE